MANPGTIVLVEDDEDDVDLIKTVISESFPQHEFKIFDKLELLFEWLNVQSEKPFIIICNSDWRNRNEVKLRNLSDQNPHLMFTKIPLILFTTDTRKEKVNNAFENLNVQGYFEKGSNYDQIKENLITIVNYWERSCTPSVG